MSWVGGLFDNAEIDFPDSTTWAVIETIQSKVMRDFDKERTILRCRQVGSPSEGKEAIIKVHMQIPDSCWASADELAEQATTSLGLLARTEFVFLSHLTEKGCSSTPRLLQCVQMQQTKDMCLSGGYILFILMEKLPGKMILDFWDYDRAKRDRIRKGFKSSWLEMNKAGVSHGDPALRNLLWDDETGKCYILDFEDADFIDHPKQWTEVKYALWDLAESSVDGMLL